ncbi:hypothetical protein D4764_13G0007100 [Takifugu flavidus]|uniref:Uncharacterized protein n=1 Tax=Takifugu flavidus TaxID=433684 RepID=A0A5C6PBE7_9TELE|nr:hypothetical protein D4764_13G0007100 [Takifugu flavidus]
MVLLMVMMMVMMMISFDLQCQANIKTYFLCMTESDQRVKILKNPDGTTRNFTEGEPVFFAPEPSTQEPERSSSRTMLRVSAPHLGGTRARVTSTICPPLGANVLKLAPSAGTGRWWNIFGSLLTTTKIPSSQIRSDANRLRPLETSNAKTQSRAGILPGFLSSRVEISVFRAFGRADFHPGGQKTWQDSDLPGPGPTPHPQVCHIITSAGEQSGTALIG